jgi:hypothetical protein
MSVYSTRILQDSPSYYFKIDNSTVDSAGSATPTVTTGGSNTFYTTGGVNNSGYMYVGATSGSGYGFSFNDTAAIFNDRTFTIEGFFKVASADMTSGIKWLFHTGDTLNGVYLQKTDKLYVVGFFNGAQVDSSAITVAYDQWTHFAVVVNTSTMKLYINGTEVGSATTPASISMDSDAKYFMQSTTNRAGIKGNFDELSVFNSALSSTIIGEHFAAFADANVPSSTLTSSGLFVNPTITVQKENIYSASPMTASAASGDHFASTVYFPTTLDSYLASLSLEQRFKFDLLSPSNLGTGGTVTLSKQGNPIIMGVGPDGYPVTEFYGDSNDASYSQTTAAIFTPEVSDNDFTIGVWFKFASDYGTQSKGILALQGSSTHDEITIRLSNKNLVYRYETSSGDNAYTSSVDVTDGNWHFAAIRHTGSSLTYYLDGSSVNTATTTGSRNTPTVFGLGFGGTSGNTKKWYLSNVFISTASAVGSTEISNIWTAGTHQIQGNAFMPMPAFKNNTAYNDFIETLTPVYDIRFNESSGLPINYGSSAGYAGLYMTGSSYSTKQTSKNNHAYKFTNYNTFIGEGYNVDSGFSDNTKTVSVYAKLIQPTTDEIIYLDGAFGFGQGFWLNSYLGGIQFIYAPTGSYGDWKIITAGTSNFGAWHLYTMVRDGSDMKFYVDGKQVGSTQTITGYNLTNSGPFYVGGGETVWYGYSPATTEKNIDELQVFNYALTQQQIFEMYQKITIDGASPATSLFVHPSISVGTGKIVSADPATASGLFVDPTQQDEIKPTIAPMTAFGDFVHPNFEAIGNVSNAADPMTASATGENPVVSVNEVLGVLHMNASATIGDHKVLIPGFWNANPMIAIPVEMIQPGIATTQGGLVLAQVMTLSASMVIPPAYKSLLDDKWYDLLYSQHSVRHNFRNANGGGNGEAILKLFDDVITDKATGSTITNNLTTTITTDGLVLDETSPVMKMVAEFNPTNNTPLLGIGYFDDYERKAVKFNNITTGYEDSNYTNTSFSFELSIKTTKSNQIIAFGKTRSFYGYQQYTTSYGLSDGKLFLKSTAAIGPAPISHYKEFTNGNTIIGNKRIDDGQWHHIVIQNGWDDNRIQFWIDGDLDIQRIGGLRLDGPSFLGFNSQATTYASDFQTSAWSYDSHAFARELEIDNHRYAYIKYEPVRAEPMIASATSGDHLGAGNRARALMLYWWPTDTFQGAPFPARFDAGGQTGLPTFDESLSTADFIKSGPQEYYGWDIFPVDITGLYVSDLVKPEAYGGKQNILVGSKPFIGTGQNYNKNPEYLYNSQGSFRDPITDARRYIDVVNDIDLRNFDAIFFRNFPDESIEKDEYTTTQIVDSYFGSKEAGLYEDFLKSLRAAVDTGLSLYVTNYQLALDLGIVDRVETVPDMDDLSGFDSDPYSPTIVPGGEDYRLEYSARWFDSNKNNRLRIVNELEGFTTEPSFIYTDYTYYLNDDQITFGGPSRPFYKYTYRPDGLKVGDEFVIANDKRGSARDFYAVPFANVKAGTIITAFANNVRRGLDLITNPYRNYATSIVVKPGDVLKGTQCGGKIVVNFTENLNGATDWGNVDLVTDYWINVAYNDEFIDEATKNTLLNASYNLDRRRESGNLTQTEYDELIYWSSNGQFIISNATLIDDPTTSRPKDGLAKGVRSSIVTKTRKSGTSYSARVSTQSQWFTFEYSYLYPRMGIKVPNILSRGFWWLSNRESYDGIVERPLAATASAVFVDPVATGQKDRSVNAASMIASATVVQASGTSAASINIAPLPMQATALMNNYVTRYIATPMTASAVLRTDNRIFTTAVDEVVVYVYHTDPILYLREDVIK